MIILNGPYIPMKIAEDDKLVDKKPEEFDLEDFKKMEKNAKAKKLLYFGRGPDEYTRISECESAKEIWNALCVAHEGTNQVKQSRIELLLRKYELFEMSVLSQKSCIVLIIILIILYILFRLIHFILYIFQV